MGGGAGWPGGTGAVTIIECRTAAETAQAVDVLCEALHRCPMAAVVPLPGSGATPAQLATHRERVWKQLGADARARYEAYGAATRAFATDRPHHHLNMIGVRRSHTGQGFGRLLLEAVHEMSRADHGSCGVSLTTETPNNVALYEHVGYRVTGHVRLSPDLETWGMFRADS